MKMEAMLQWKSHPSGHLSVGVPLNRERSAPARIAPIRWPPAASRRNIWTIQIINGERSVCSCSLPAS